MKILVVDDHKENQYLLEAMFRGGGHEVQAVANGAEALERLKAGGVDLIISDILMPVMDGFQLCRKVKTDESVRHIPFIIYTATYTGPQDEVFAMKIGADRFIQKPCEPEVFMKAVDELMAASGQNLSSSEPESLNEEETLKLYSERLVRKLEQKMLQLELELKRRQQAEEERARLMAAIEQAGEIVLITDTDGIIQYVNPVFETVTGYSYHEAIGQNPRMLLKSGKQDLAFYQDLWGTITAGKTWKGRIINKRKDGKHFIEAATISPVYDATGQVVNFVAVKRDITEQLKLEAQLAQAQKIETVGQLVSGVAHDYNNMLSVILGYTELALIKVTPDDPLRADLQQILKAAKRSIDITQQLLIFARKQAVLPQVLDLNQAVEGAHKMLRQLAGENIDLVWLPATDLWPLKIDPSQVDQILVNLCVNARDAIADVGKITIETGNVTIDETYSTLHPDAVPGDFIKLTISDDGCGMDKETQEKIFEPFFTTKKEGEGTGLGLATCYGIVKQNEGFISVYSEPGQGTVFKVYLPRYVGEGSHTGAENMVEIPSGRGETILVVEDDFFMLKLTERILDGLGYKVLTAKNPEEARSLTKENYGEIRLLITDIVMPEMNGRDLANQVNALSPRIKTLFMSGYTAKMIARKGVLEEGSHFIQKPFLRKDLAVKVRKVLDN